MLSFLTLLLVCQLLGTVIQEALDLPVPGAVIGMALLFLGLVIRGRLPEGLHRVSLGLLDNLSLLFVPAGVGVMQEIGLLRNEWLPIVGALVGSCVITIGATGLVMQAALRFSGKAADPSP
jgi:holin-like protein